MDEEHIANSLRASATFAGAPDAALADLAAALDPRHIDAGETIVSEGEAGGEFYLLAAGQLSITGERDGETKHFATISPGETFGEIASLTGGERLATVTADESGLLLVLPRATFQSVLHRYPRSRRNRIALAGTLPPRRTRCAGISNHQPTLP